MIHTIRSQVKWQMKVDRGGFAALCDLCHVNIATDMHEIIGRGRTVANDAAREASFDKHICSLLCQECHVLNQRAEYNEAALLAFNMSLYGREPVLTAIKAVADLLHTPLMLDIPEEGTYDTQRSA